MHKLSIIILVVVSCSKLSNKASISSGVLSTSLMSAQRVIDFHGDALLVANDRIATDQGTLSNSALNMTVDAGEREFLSHLIACAIPNNIVLDPSGLGFFGELGLAPEWLNGPLSDTSRKWVSACILSRISGDSFANAISLRGPHTLLSTDVDERNGWPRQEGAFYGNIFTPADRPVDWFACNGRDGGNGIDRICAQEDPANPGKTKCGFKFAGNCMDVCKIRPAGAGFYTQCRFGSQIFDEAITTYITPL